MNDPWFDSWLESQRLAMRTWSRWQYFLVCRHLQKAERTLGELGWQQAYFDDNDSAVHELQRAEQRQARLLFDIAETREQIAQLKAEALEKTTTLQSQIRDAETATFRLEAHAIQLLQALEREKIAASADYLIASIQKSIDEEETRLRQSRQALHQLHELLTQSEKLTRLETDRLQTILRTLEAESQLLQQKKAPHFAKIGQDLADVGIAPLNQPHILPQVLGLREKSATLRYLIATSLAHSRTLPQPIRWGAYLTCTLLLFAAVSLILLLGLIFFRLVQLS